jgi:hypothetical protein
MVQKSLSEIGFGTRPRGGWRGVAGMFCLCVLAGAIPALPAAAAAPDNQELSAPARAQIRALAQAKANRTPAQRKMGSHLVYAAKKRRGLPVADGVPSQPVLADFAADGRVLVDIDADVGDALLAAIAAAGGEVVESVPAFRAVRAWLPPEQVEDVAGRSDVRFIRPAAKAVVHTGSVNSEGDTSHGAAAARLTNGVTGAGIKVGVISDSIDYLANAQGTSDLGIVNVLSGQSGLGKGLSGEGTAMLEIVHDLAPGAELYFATAYGSEAGYAQNILNLRAAGCDIIVDDAMYWDEPPFQDGVVAQAVNSVTAAGALYFAAAGNSGNLKYGSSGTWEGNFSDGGAAGALYGSVGRLHSFSGQTYNSITAVGAAGRADLFWSDPWNASTNDYDLYVLDSTGTTVLRSSTDPQTGSEQPYESVGIANIGERLVIVLWSGTNRFLHLETGWGRLAIRTTGATRGHCAGSNTIGVAAVDVMNNAYPYLFQGGSLNWVEDFSADGPRRVFFQPDGTPITPGNFLSTGGLLLQKPDLAAADDVSTTLSTFDPFYGTSAAAPHAAAIAALAWSFDHSLPAATIRAAMSGTALDLEGPGTDSNAGAGIVMAAAVLQALTSNAAPGFAAARLGETVGNGNGVVDRGETLVEWISWTNRSFTARTHVSATLATATPGVTVVQGSSSYPDLPIRGQASNAVAFSYQVAKTVSAGTVATFTNVLTCDGFVCTAAFTRTVGTALYDRAPVASNQAVTVLVGASTALVLRASDADADPYTFRVIADPVRGSLQGLNTNSGAVTYQAAGNYAGADLFTFVANDGYTNSAAATVTVTVVAATTNTLTVVSAHGGALPGTLAAGTWSEVSQWITNSPVLQGATQYVCAGGSVAGNAYAQPGATNVTLTLTNAATLTWAWQTNCLIAAATNGSGSVTGGGWYALGASAVLTAVPAVNWHFAGWSGDTNGCILAGTTLTAAVTQARALTANFASDFMTLTVVSTAGATRPGTVTTNFNASFHEYITNTVVTLGGTQYTCTAASVAGNAFTLVSPTNVALTLTNNATLTWYWQTAPLQIVTPASLAPGTVGYPCGRALAATGGVPPYAWSLVSGSLPPGLGLASTGLISGTAASKGTASFTARVTGADGLFTNRDFTLTINAAASDVGYFWTNFVGLAGTSGTANGTGTTARFNAPSGVTLDTNGNLFVTDQTSHTLRRVTPAGIVTTLAGLAGTSGTNNGTNATARFNNPHGVAVDTNGAVYVADSSSHTLRKVTPSGTNWVVTTIAGTAGTSGTSDGTGSVARFNTPAGICIDSNGCLFVADQYNQAIRMVTPAGTNWAVTTIAGLAGLANAGSTDGTGSVARFRYPMAVSPDSAGNLYVADKNNYLIRMAAPSATGWVVRTLAGTAQSNGSTDGTGSVVRFDTPCGIAADGTGGAVICDSYNSTIRRLAPSGTNWVASTVGGLAGNTGSANGTGSVARFIYPFGVAAATGGALYVADRTSYRIARGVPLPIPVVTTPSPLPDGLAGSPYSQALAAAGTAPFTWIVTSGELPAGLQLSSGGVISGTPAGAGTAAFVVQVTGGDGLFGTRAFGLTIAAPAPPVTLTVDGARGAASPTNGAYLYATGSLVSATVPAVVGNAATQYVCTGGAVAGNDFTLVATTNVTLVLTNTAWLSWTWQTNYWLHVTADGNGSAAPADVWCAEGSSVPVVATPSNYYGVAGWGGQTGGAAISGSQITVPMDMPRTLQALFAALLATNNVPQWWLAQYGLTNGGFDSNAVLDADVDGMPNWAEYIAGTDPTNAASLLRIAGIAPGSAVAFAPTFTNRTYAVLWASNLLSAGWQTLDAYQPGTGAVTVLPAAGGSNGFYRIGVQLR